MPFEHLLQQEEAVGQCKQAESLSKKEADLRREICNQYQHLGNNVGETCQVCFIHEGGRLNEFLTSWYTIAGHVYTTGNTYTIWNA